MKYIKNINKYSKFNLKEKKENVITSLFEVENFLKQTQNTIKYYKLLIKFK